MALHRALHEAAIWPRLRERCVLIKYVVKAVPRVVNWLVRISDLASAVAHVELRRRSGGPRLWPTLVESRAAGWTARAIEAVACESARIHGVGHGRTINKQQTKEEARLGRTAQHRSARLRAVLGAA